MCGRRAGFWYFYQRRHYSEATAREADEAVQELLECAFALASGTLQQHCLQLDILAERLLEEEVVTGDQVVQLVRKAVESEVVLGSA